jgi:hypothetical protein
MFQKKKNKKIKERKEKDGIKKELFNRLHEQQ